MEMNLREYSPEIEDKRSSDTDWEHIVRGSSINLSQLVLDGSSNRADVPN